MLLFLRGAVGYVWNNTPYANLCLCQTVGSLKQTMIHAMTSSKQTHDISGSEEKPPPATASLFELGKRKNVNETYRKIPWVCPLGNLGNNPCSESSAKFSLLLPLSRQMTHEVLMFCPSFWNVALHLLANVWVQHNTIMKTVWCFPKSLPVSALCLTLE